MTVGDIFLILSLLLTVLSILLMSVGKNIRFAEKLLVGVFILLTIDVLLLTYYFLSSDFRYFYVYSYSSRELPLVYKFSAVWAGQEGTYLLWAWIISISIFILLQEIYRKRYRNVIAISTGVNAFIIFLTILMSPYKTIYEIEPSLPETFIPPDGRGLNPLLQDPWMAIHPPIIFIGYAFVTITFAGLVLYLWTNDPRYEVIGRSWAKGSWLFLTLGIAVGGYWSYKVLGWGGFWAWDPVETSSLIPWLTLTAYLHGSYQFRTKQAFRLYTPSMGIITFILVVYATFITRSGLWQSVHAFSETTSGLFLAGFLIFGLVMLIFSVYYHDRKYKMEEDESQDHERTIFFITVVTLSILAFISFWGLTFPLISQAVRNQQIAVDPEFFNLWSYPFVLILLGVLGFCFAYNKRNIKLLIKISLIFAILTLVLLFITPSKDYMLVEPDRSFFVKSSGLTRAFASLSLLSLVPPVIYALIGIGFAIRREWKKLLDPKNSLRVWGKHIIHISIIFILAGAVVSTSFESEQLVTFAIGEQGIIKMVDGTGIKLYGFDVHQDGQGFWKQAVSVGIYSGGTKLSEGVAIFRDSPYGTVTDVYIDRGIFKDIYVIFQGVVQNPNNPSEILIPLKIKIIPWVMPLWTGIVLMASGMVCILVDDLRLKRKREKNETNENRISNLEKV